MILSQGLDNYSGEVFVGPNNFVGRRDKIIPMGDAGWTSLGNQVRSRHPSNTSERNINFQRQKPAGTNFGELVRVMPQKIQQDIFLDNEIGAALRVTKAKFGKAPFIEAYKKVLTTSKKIDDRRKASLAEEARLRSVMKAGED